MLDKNKLILLFNIYVGGINTEDIFDYLQETTKGISSYFDDSVKCIFAITKNENKPAVENVTDFPTDGLAIIENLIELKDTGDERAFNIQLEAVRDFIKGYKNGQK